MRSSRGPLIALVGLLVLDVALVAFAFKGGAAPASSPSSAARTTTSASTTAAAPKGSATTSATTAPVATATNGQARPLTESVVALDGSTAWRLTLGSCAGASSAIAVSTDGGKTWADRKSPFAGLIRVQPNDGTTAFVVGADKNCAMSVRRTTDGAQTWSARAGLGDTWARDMADATKVKVPGDRTAAPCGATVVLDLVRTSASAAQALCSGGALQETSNEGSTWAKVGQVDGALAFDNRIEGGGVTAYLVTQTSRCAGLAVTSMKAGTATPLACVATGDAAVTAGTVSLSVVGNDGWLVAADSTWRSRDGFKTWAKA